MTTPKVASKNLIETIKDSSKNPNLDSALAAVIDLLGDLDGGTVEFFVLDNFHEPSTGDHGNIFDIRYPHEGMWRYYTTKERAKLLCKLVAISIETAIED